MEILNKNLVIALQNHAANEILVTNQVADDFLEGSREMDLAEQNKIGWSSFTREIGINSGLPLDLVRSRLASVERSMSSLEGLLEQRFELDEAVLQMTEREYTSYLAARKAILIATGELDPYVILEIDSQQEVNNGDFYLPVDWSGSWGETVSDNTEKPVISTSPAPDFDDPLWEQRITGHA